MKFATLWLFALTVALAGCFGNLRHPSAAPVGEEAAVNLRQLQIVQTVDGHRAVLLRLSRPPTLVRHSSDNEPGRIHVEAWGPEGEGDLSERALEQSDAEIHAVRVSRTRGALHVTLDFRSAQAPTYSVHEMADYIMIRLNTGPEQG